jgi:uncharacterized protein YrrD
MRNGALPAHAVVMLDHTNARTMRLRLGAPVVCSDERFGELAAVVIDPSARHVTHLVVQPRRHHGLARLVPVDLASAGPASEGDVSLCRSADEIRRLEPVQEFAFLPFDERPAPASDWDVGVEDLLAFPRDDAAGLETCWPVEPRYAISYDRIPKGAAELRRVSPVSSADERVLGRVDGLLIDVDAGITHLLLRRGHLWWRRELTIPIDCVAKLVSDAVALRLTIDEVAALDPVRAGRRPGAGSLGVLRRTGVRADQGPPMSLRRSTMNR